jgi:hypothetical protein
MAATSAAEVVAAGMAATSAAEVGSAHACRRAHPRAEEAAAGASAAKAPRAAMAATTAEAAAYLAAPSSAAKALALSVEVDIADIFSNRPAWCADRLRYDGKDLGDLTAHYIAGMVGLTADFNDAEDTTLADVLAKFDEAIKLAEELGV